MRQFAAIQFCHSFNHHCFSSAYACLKQLVHQNLPSCDMQGQCNFGRLLFSCASLQKHATSITHSSMQNRKNNATLWPNIEHGIKAIITPLKKWILSCIFCMVFLCSTWGCFFLLFAQHSSLQSGLHNHLFSRFDAIVVSGAADAHA